MKSLHSSRSRLPQITERLVVQREVDEGLSGVDRHVTEDLDTILVPLYPTDHHAKQ